MRSMDFAEFHRNKLLQNMTGLMFLIRALAHADVDSQITTAPIPICKALTHVGEFEPMILAVVI